MKVLVACEFSGVVRDAFALRGHDAWSCDLLPTERPGKHIQWPVEKILGQSWDLMIAHPPCTHLCVSGARWFKDKRNEQADALAFVRFLLDAPIRRIALENPIGVISTQIRKPDQIIQPFQFGHSESKATCLWLKNLPTLMPTKLITRPAAWIRCPCCENFFCTIHKMHAHDCQCPPIEEWKVDPYSDGTGRWNNQTPTGQNNLGPSQSRWSSRSRTYQGIADAMAQQWGGL